MFFMQIFFYPRQKISLLFANFISRLHFNNLVKFALSFMSGRGGGLPFIFDKHYFLFRSLNKLIFSVYQISIDLVMLEKNVDRVKM